MVPDPSMIHSLWPNRWLQYWLCALFAVCAVVDAARAAEKDLDAPAPVFSSPGGVYTNQVTITVKTNDAVVRISLDGSEPNFSSPIYEKPLVLTNCMLVRAKAWYADGRVSETISHNYVLLDADLLRFSSNLPLVILNSSAAEIAPAEKSIVATRIVNAPAGRVTPYSTPDFDGLVLSNVRGHSSLRYPKHSYNLKIVNEQSEPRNISLLGMPKESEWVLYGPYPDKTLMRDVLAYELSNQMGRWAPHTRFIEAFVVESPARLSMAHYAGVYVLSEKITRDKNRVNIAKIDPSINREPEISGGYIFKKDHSSRRERKKFDADGPPQAPNVTNRAGFPTGPGGFPADPAGFLPPYESKAPKGSKATTTTTRVTSNVVRPTNRPTPAKKPKTDPNAPVTNYVAVAIPETTKIDDETIFLDEEAFRTTLQRNQFYFYEPEPDELTAVQRSYLKDFVNRFETVLYGADFTNAASGYQTYVDSDSFIDYHLLSEITKNVDAFRFSTFYYKDRGGRLNMGPLWDWNLSFGNANGKQGWISTNWLWPQLDDQQYSWFRRLFDDPDFDQKYVDRWAQLRTNVFATSNILSRIDQIASLLDEAQERNFDKWEILGRSVNPNWFVGDTYEEEVDWMKQWVSNRLDWIENQFVRAPRIVHRDTLELRGDTPDLPIYFTLDGTDPRASGGGISSTAQSYKTPFAPKKNSRLVARVQVGARWSAPLRASF
jgi:hypothetical protein